MESIVNILKDSDALLEGHFLLSSGKHSNAYVQCAKVIRYPQYAKKVLEVVAKKIKDIDVDIIVGPAMGGVIVSYELARQLDKEAIFTERENNIMKLRRGFEIPKGSKILIAEDVVTTGKSSLEVKKLLEDEYGANVVAIACIVNRTNDDIGLPIYSAINLDIKVYEADECPLCGENKIPLVKPGSRKF